MGFRPTPAVSALLAIGLVLALYGALTSDLFALARFPDADARAWAVHGASWLGVGILLLFARSVEGGPLVIWKEERPAPLRFGLSVGMLFVVVLSVAATFTMLWRWLMPVALDPGAPPSTEAALGTAAFVFAAVSAGGTEELIFRGFLQPRIALLFKQPWVAVVLPSFLFGLAHYQRGDLFGVLLPFVIGVLFALYYQKYRSLSVAVTCHVLIDLVLV
ncbi:MAG: CPBP family intramembrane metalloprotease [Flavobacteriales bacterium]|nr:CPBP family intramembrane metalloprotease [Flavobacteriales bacterium]